MNVLPGALELTIWLILHSMLVKFHTDLAWSYESIGLLHLDWKVVKVRINVVLSYGAYYLMDSQLTNDSILLEILPGAVELMIWSILVRVKSSLERSSSFFD